MDTFTESELDLGRALREARDPSKQSWATIAWKHGLDEARARALDAAYRKSVPKAPSCDEAPLGSRQSKKTQGPRRSKKMYRTMTFLATV